MLPLKNLVFKTNFIDCYLQIMCLVGIEFQCQISAERSTIGHKFKNYRERIWLLIKSAIEVYECDISDSKQESRAIYFL